MRSVQLGVLWTWAYDNACAKKKSKRKIFKIADMHKKPDTSAQITMYALKKIMNCNIYSTT